MTEIAQCSPAVNGDIFLVEYHEVQNQLWKPTDQDPEERKNITTQGQLLKQIQQVSRQEKR